MDKKYLSELILNLTGKPVRPFDDDDPVGECLIQEIIRNKNHCFDWNEFNELLLNFNKDRISPGFFQFFFLKKESDLETKLSIKQIENGVAYFRKLAMRAYGNIIFAYRTLSRLTYKQIESRLRECVRDSKSIIKDFKNRAQKLQDLREINTDSVHLLGYLTVGGMDVDSRTAVALQDAGISFYKKRLKQDFCHFSLNYIKSGKAKIESNLLPGILHQAKKVLQIYFEINKPIDIDKFNKFLNESVLKTIALRKKMKETKDVGKFNNAVYLTWDHMDVYLATSMRRKWEFQNLYSFVNKLFKNKKLKELKLRYFDPTQSYDDSRICKGLTEGLMLKRAKCTIYSIQESDTFGKDSELAATLAQGKPVIAFVPKIDVDKHSKELEGMPIEFFIYEMRVLFETFEKTETRNHCLRWLKNKRLDIVSVDLLEKFLNNFNEKINKFNAEKVWNTIETPWARDKDFKKKHRNDFKTFCYLISIADKYLYDGRATTLMRHPLGIQVNLNTGVANGVLVVRKIDKCAELLYSILTNQYKFESGY
ncbi:MAG: hypothetical protein ACYDFR_03320, partial [Candidatus Omnitrophota bacterium]